MKTIVSENEDIIKELKENLNNLILSCKYSNYYEEYTKSLEDKIFILNLKVNQLEREIDSLKSKTI